MTDTRLKVRVLPDLPDALAPATPGGQRRREIPPPTDGATALDPAMTADPGTRPAADLRVLPGGAAEQPSGAAEQPSGAADRRRMFARAHRFVQAVVEIVSGDRPCAQLVRWTDRAVYDSLTTRVAALSDTVGSVPPTERPRARVVSVKVCRPRDGVAEVAAHVRQGKRSHALAARLEYAEQRWICTALELG
jgi:uncharacterized protein DUF6459